MKKLLIGIGSKQLVATSVSVIALTAAANAADMQMPSSVKDAMDALGLTVYGALDVGVAYQTNGARESSAWGQGIEYNVVGNGNLNRSPLAAIVPNAMQQSFVGLKLDKALGWADVNAIGRVESGFVPTSGELYDGCASLMRNNGLANTVSDSKGDSSRCGQIFNGEAYGGLSSATFGTLTLGRQNSLMQEKIGGYDPQSLSYAFSLIGFSGTLSGGTGNTETARWDDSVKYEFQSGPFHAAGMYAAGGPETGMMGQAYGGNIGFAWTSPMDVGRTVGISLDGVYDNGKGLISASSLSAAQCAGIGLTVPACEGTKDLAGTLSDTQTWGVMGKVTFAFGNGSAPSKAGKAVIGKAPPKEPAPVTKLTFYGGYEHVTYNNPSSKYDTGSGGATLDTLSGYVLATVNLSNYDTAKQLDVYWTGASFETGPWRLAAAYYGEHQNSWLAGATPTACTGLGTPAVTSNCAGNGQTVSGSIDYAFNKYFDVYGGVAYSWVDGGFTSGFGINGNTASNPTNTTTVASGLRVRF